MTVVGRHPLQASAKRRVDARAAAYSRSFGDALRAADAGGAEAVVQRALKAGLPPATIQSRVIAPAMHRIGDLWAAGAITVADEHLATAICQRVLAGLYPAFHHGPTSTRRRILLASVEGQHHALGLRMAADVLEGAGHDVLHLGSDVPTDALITAVERHDPELVCLGATMPLGGSSLVAALHGIQEARPDVLVLLGGQGIPRRLKDAGWPYVEHSDMLLGAVEVLFAARPQMPTATPPVSMGLGEVLGSMQAHALGTVEHRLGKLVSEAADVAREQTQRARALYDAAFRDPLTDLSNRRALDERIEDGVPAGSVLLMIDLDHFKTVNDTYGHAEGDVLLRRVGDLMREGLRLGDFAARYGGDEFAVLLPGLDAEQAGAIAERLRATTEAALADHGVTLSIGAAAGGEADALERADRALYRAKRAGKNRVVNDA